MEKCSIKIKIIFNYIVPSFILFNVNLIDDINDCRINRETCKNYIHDIGIDIIQFNKDNNEISFNSS